MTAATPDNECFYFYRDHEWVGVIPECEEDYHEKGVYDLFRHRHWGSAQQTLEVDDDLKGTGFEHAMLGFLFDHFPNMTMLRTNDNRLHELFQQYGGKKLKGYNKNKVTFFGILREKLKRPPFKFKEVSWHAAQDPHGEQFDI